MNLLPCVLLLSSLSPRAQQPTTPPLQETQQQQDEKPLPPFNDLLRDVERNEKSAEAKRRDYTYHVHAEQQELDNNSNPRKTTITDSESLTIDGVRVDRVTAGNGKPLTHDEAKKESERIDKEVAKDKARREKHEAKDQPTDSRGDDVLTVSRILELGSFSNPRRITLNDRPTIVADYAGDPHAKTRNRFETMFRDLVGTVWIDEQDHALAQAQGHFLNDFKIGGGLVADIRKNSSFSARWTKINNDAWLPVTFEGQGKIRVLLVAGFSGHIRLTMSDYRKFHASATIIPSNRLIGPDGQPLPNQPPTEPTTPPNPAPTNPQP
jgi:hypothetical protein